MAYRKDIHSEAEFIDKSPSDDSLVGVSQTEPLDSGARV